MNERKFTEQDLFDGYVISDGKAPIEKYKHGEKLRTLEEVQNCKSYCGKFASHVIMIDFDTKEQFETVKRIVKAERVNCYIRPTDNGGHLYFYDESNSITKCSTKSFLACGLLADIKGGFTNAVTNIKKNGKLREIENKELDRLDPLPKWLYPLRSQYRQNPLELKDGDGRNSFLYKSCTKLYCGEYFTLEETRETLRIINQYIFDEPIDDKEFKEATRDEAFKFIDETDASDYFFEIKKGSTTTKFLHTKFGDYLIRVCNVKRINNALHVYDNGVYKLVVQNKDTDLLAQKAIEILPFLTEQSFRKVMFYIRNTVKVNECEAEPKFFSFKNCILNIETLEELPHDPNMIFLNKSPHNWVSDAQNDIADKILKDIFLEDTEAELCFLEFIGYCHYRSNLLRKCLHFDGQPRNGKSTLMAMLRNIVGKDNYIEMDIRDLAGRFDSAAIYQKTAIFSDDIKTIDITDSTNIKKVSSGDMFRGEIKYGDNFNFKPYCTPISTGNGYPRLKDDPSGAVTERIIPLRLLAKFDEDDPNTDIHLLNKVEHDAKLAEYLIKEGILEFHNLLNDETKSFTQPKYVKEARAELHETNNPVELYFKERTVKNFLDKTYEETCIDYEYFCTVEKVSTLSRAEFSKLLRKRYNIALTKVTKEPITRKSIKRYELQ